MTLGEFHPAHMDNNEEVRPKLRRMANSWTRSLLSGRTRVTAPSQGKPEEQVRQVLDALLLHAEEMAWSSLIIHIELLHPQLSAREFGT